jgi:hypothetical protein
VAAARRYRVAVAAPAGREVPDGTGDVGWLGVGDAVDGDGRALDEAGDGDVLDADGLDGLGDGLTLRGVGGATVWAGVGVGVGVSVGDADPVAAVIGRTYR